MRALPTSLRLTVDGRKYLDGLKATLGISGAAIIELALRELARKHKVSIK
jgi:hypothetical protein